MEAIEKREIKNWDKVTIILLILSGGLILFSFFAPYYFTKAAKSSDLDFTATGAIGDTLGGIMNPFIALVGILLTFLAFYMQIKANQLQRQLFIDGLTAEKNKELAIESKEHLTRLKVIKALLDSMLKYFKNTGGQLHDYVEMEKTNPLKPNVFNSSTSASYQNFMKLDLLETYKSLVFYFNDKDVAWEKDFIQVLDLLDFYDKMIIELRTTYKIHSNSKFQILNETGEKLNEIMNEIFVNPDLKDNKNNQAFLDNTINDADFEKIQIDFLRPIIKDILKLFKANGEPVFRNFLDGLSYVNKKIGGEKFQALNHADNFETYYNAYFIDNNEFMKRIENFNRLIEV